MIRYKKIMSIAMSMVVMATAFSTNVFAVACCPCIDKDRGRRVTISNTGVVDLPDNYPGIGKIIVPEGRQYGEVEAVNINANVSKLVGTFEGCTGLTGIKIPCNVTKIGDNTFSGCTSLKKVEIENITKEKKVIDVGGNGASAYSACCDKNSNYHDTYEKNLGVETIGNSAFKGCTELPSINIPNSVTKIGDNAFMDCEELDSIKIPDSVTSIGDNAFSGCKNLKEVTIGDGIKIIPKNAFYNCTNLDKITIGNKVWKIEENAFDGCGKLDKIKIPNTVTEISKDAFEGCTSFKKVTIDSQNIVNDFSKIFNDLQIEEVIIGDNVEKIGVVFKGCKSLEEVTIGKGIKTIDEMAFMGCENLETVLISESVENIDEMAFMGCISLKNVKIINSEEKQNNSNYKEKQSNHNNVVGKMAFATCTKLKKIDIPKTVKTIDKYAFMGCLELSEVYIPDKTQKICEFAFACCPNLKKVSLLNKEVERVGYAFAGDETNFTYRSNP